MRFTIIDILNHESARKATFHQHFPGKFSPESLKCCDWTIFHGTSPPCFICNNNNSNNYPFFSCIYLMFIYLLDEVLVNKETQEFRTWPKNSAILNSHLVNNAYLLSCIISGFAHFYSSRLEKWWCTVSICKKETEVERIKKRRNFLHNSAAGFNRYVVNQSNKWNRCTRKEGNQETQQSYAQITE